MTNMISYSPHGVVELSNLKATECGHYVNLLVTEDNGIDNGSFVTFDIADADNGYSATALGIDVLGKALPPAVTDEVYLVASMPMIYEDYAPKMREESNFFNGKGEVARCAELVYGDRFGISKECVINPEDIAVGKYIVITGSGYKATVANEPGDSAFIGYVYAVAANGNYYVFVLKNGASEHPSDNKYDFLSPKLTMWNNGPQEDPSKQINSGQIGIIWGRNNEFMLTLPDTLEFSVSDDTVASLEKTPYAVFINPLGPGTIILTATDTETGQVEQCEVTVSGTRIIDPDDNAFVSPIIEFYDNASFDGNPINPSAFTWEPGVTCYIKADTYPTGNITIGKYHYASASFLEMGITQEAADQMFGPGVVDVTQAPNYTINNNAVTLNSGYGVFEVAVPITYHDANNNEDYYLWATNMIVTTKSQS